MDHHNPEYHNIEYYNQNASLFYERTVNREAVTKDHHFLSYLNNPSASILDAGCGSGRDTKVFKELGYKVSAFDASQEMVTLATKYTGEPVQLLRFQDLAFNEQFDGIWARASLIHVAYPEMRDALEKLHRALKPGGILYMSFKYGETEHHASDRYFYDMTEQTIKLYTDSLFTILETWQSPDETSAPSVSKTWFHVIARKI